MNKEVIKQINQLRQVVCENKEKMQVYGVNHWCYYLCKALVEDAQDELQRIKEKKRKVLIYKQLNLF